SEKNRGLDQDVQLITVSVDTPFAQRRFGEEAKIRNVTFLSDYRGGDFGRAHGLLVPDLPLLARSVMVVDKDNVVRYLQVVPELGEAAGAMHEFDLLVIGSGPAGQKTAIQAAKLRKRVAVIEKEQVLGGSCINTGTLPSKTLKDAIYYLHGFKLRSFTNITYSLKKNMTLRDLMARKDLVIRHELEVITNQLERNDVEIIQGTASFADPHTLRVVTKSGDQDTFTAPFILIATGSRPRRPEEIPFNDVTICDADSILSTEVIPKSMIVMG